MIFTSTKSYLADAHSAEKSDKNHENLTFG